MFAENLKYLRKSHGLDQKSFADRIGRSVSTVSEWESGKYTPKAGILADIANIFNVKIDDMMSRDLSKSDASIIDNTISKMKHLNSDRQQNVYNYATHQLSEQNNNVVQLSDYTDNVEHTETVYGAVSAGTGQYLDHEQPEQVVVRGPAPEHDFAVKVVGNSMEPTFNDGQIVYVNKLVDESDIRNNQFVIAEVNGEAFIKKLSFSEDYVKLISLNPNYDDIIIHDYDDFLIRGIVVI